MTPLYFYSGKAPCIPKRVYVFLRMVWGVPRFITVLEVIPGLLAEPRLTVSILQELQ